MSNYICLILFQIICAWAQDSYQIVQTQSSQQSTNNQQIAQSCIALGIIIIFISFIFYLYKHQQKYQLELQSILPEAEILLRSSLDNIVNDYHEKFKSRENARQMLIDWQKQKLKELKIQYIRIIDLFEVNKQEEEELMVQSLLKNSSLKNQKAAQFLLNFEMKIKESIHQQHIQKNIKDSQNSALAEIKSRQLKWKNRKGYKKNDTVLSSFMYGANLNEQKLRLECQMKSCGLKIKKFNDEVILQIRNEVLNLSSLINQNEEINNSLNDKMIESINQDIQQSKQLIKNVDISELSQEKQQDGDDSKKQISFQDESNKGENLVEEAINKFVEKFWKFQVEILEQPGIQVIDKIVHAFIHQTLIDGNKNAQEKYQMQLRKNLLKHQKKIIAIKNAIKPGIFNQYFEPFSCIMIKDYFKKIYVQNDDDNDVEKQIYERRIFKQIENNIDLNLQSETPALENTHDQERLEIIQRIQSKLELAQSGIRKSPTGIKRMATQSSFKMSMIRLNSIQQSEELQEEKSRNFQARQLSPDIQGQMKAMNSFKDIRKKMLKKQKSVDVNGNQKKNFKLNKHHQKLQNLYKDDVNSISLFNKNAFYNNTNANIIDGDAIMNINLKDTSKNIYIQDDQEQTENIQKIQLFDKQFKSQKNFPSDKNTDLKIQNLQTIDHSLSLENTNQIKIQRFQNFFQMTKNDFQNDNQNKVKPL